MWFYQACNVQEKAEESNGSYKLLRYQLEAMQTYGILRPILSL